MDIWLLSVLLYFKYHFIFHMDQFTGLSWGKFYQTFNLEWYPLYITWTESKYRLLLNIWYNLWEHLGCSCFILPWICLDFCLFTYSWKKLMDWQINKRRNFIFLINIKHRMFKSHNKLIFNFNRFLVTMKSLSNLIL